MSEFVNKDGLEYMRSFPDKYFSLAIVDPPYFSGPEKRSFYGAKISPIGVKRTYQKSKVWKKPTKEYFEELF